MELALYCPDCGYYEREKDTPGRRGDYYTSVSVGRLFGELLAFQFAAWLEALPATDGEWRIVEAGAHDGRLASDILTWLHHRRPGLLARTGYWIVEPSARRQKWQRETLAQFGRKVRWLTELNAIAPRTIRGVVFSNELLDAMPVRRIGWDVKWRNWFEWGVTVDQNRFVWTPLPERLPTGLLQSAFGSLPPELLAVLPDGFTTEFSPLAGDWWRATASSLCRGKLLTLDYGLAAENFFVPQRAGGTLRAYHRHRRVEDALANPGDQDLTAHVNFTAIQRAGEAVGLKTESSSSQRRFLTGIAEMAWKSGSGFGPWTPEQTRQFQTLTHPNHLGDAFRVLVQTAEGG